MFSPQGSSVGRVHVNQLLHWFTHFQTTVLLSKGKLFTCNLNKGAYKTTQFRHPWPYYIGDKLHRVTIVQGQVQFRKLALMLYIYTCTVSGSGSIQEHTVYPYTICLVQYYEIPIHCLLPILLQETNYVPLCNCVCMCVQISVAKVCTISVRAACVMMPVEIQSIVRIEKPDGI